MSNELLFYGGLAAAACALLAAAVSFFAAKITQVRLNARLDAEYGPAAGQKRETKF